MVSTMMTMRLNPAPQYEVICYYFNASSEKQIVTIDKSPLPAEVLLQPKQGLFFEAMPDTFINTYRIIFSGREFVEKIRCQSLSVCEKSQTSTPPSTQDYAIA